MNNAWKSQFEELDKELERLFLELETLFTLDTYPDAMPSEWKKEIQINIEKVEKTKKALQERRAKLEKLMSNIRIL